MTAKFSGPAYRIVTPRLVIRCWNPTDAPMFKAAIDQNVAHLKPWLPWAAEHPQELQNLVDRLRTFRGMFDLGQDFLYGVFNPQETRVLGGTGLHPRLGPRAREIGYWIDKGFIGQGLATEISTALTRVAFEVEAVDRVEIHCELENLASAAIPRKLGYTHEATLRRRVRLIDGKDHDLMVWSLLRDEYTAGFQKLVPLEAYDALGRQIL